MAHESVHQDELKNGEGRSERRGDAELNGDNASADWGTGCTGDCADDIAHAATRAFMLSLGVYAPVAPARA